MTVVVEAWSCRRSRLPRNRCRSHEDQSETSPPSSANGTPRCYSRAKAPATTPRRPGQGRAVRAWQRAARRHALCSSRRYRTIALSPQPAGGRIGGDPDLPFSGIAQTIEAVAPARDAEIVLYCDSGIRSSVEKMTLGRIGYTNVRNAGGIDDVRRERVQP